MPASIIVWDLETVPDLRGFAAANGLIGKLEDEVRAEMGDKFPKLIYHSIVCIGAVVAQRHGEHWAVSAVGAPNIGERSEREIISAFVNRIAELAPRGGAGGGMGRIGGGLRNHGSGALDHRPRPEGSRRCATAERPGSPQGRRPAVRGARERNQRLSGRLSNPICSSRA